MENRNYIIRLAKPEELDRIMEIYDIARRFMRQQGNRNQWIGGYPQREILEEDIRQGKLFSVLKGNTIHGVFFFDRGPDATYGYIENGRWHSDAPYGVIHRIASDGSGGIFPAAMAFCLERCGYLRIDTHQDNHPMQHVVEKYGFRRCGIIYLPDGAPRIAYDRI